MQGVWKNTEDEVLKAAIAKYGKNQWARISSLLVRKTPKQCKARWYEWLDPSIKKTEWSKTEDEKLLHLAKLMPTQWRTIAPIVGRTATQCLERYQKLLDEAEARENEELGLTGPGDGGAAVDDVRRLRPGEIDPDPETKPARPDPIDMDEDEKEMLSEARARLANTQGKKAKRKARERQLEEARRLAMLQKKRELKAAGIIGSMRTKSKKKGMDYNADIPFEKKPAAGFYDTSEEQARVTAAPVGQSLRRLENKRKPEEEEAERKKRQRRNEKDGEHQTKFVAARDAQIKRLNEAETSVKRRKLVLPDVQVGEVEMEEIVKIGRSGMEARNLVGGEDGDSASGNLLGEYDGVGFDKARMARTPRVAETQDTVMTEARNLRAMVTAQTPLLGDENTPLHELPGGGTGFEGATPRQRVVQTPNPLATPRASGVDSTPLRTPLRDDLSLNAGGIDFQTPRGGRRGQASAAARKLQSAFQSLPKPENNFELLVPEDEEPEEVGVDGVNGRVEDAAERDARLKREKEEEERREFARRSLVVQMGLPRPAVVDVERLVKEVNAVEDEGDREFAEAQRLVNLEMVDLLKHDAVAFPLPGTTTAGSTRSTYQHPGDEYVAEAKSLIHLALANSLGFPDTTAEGVRQGLLASASVEPIDESALWDVTRAELVFDPTTKRWVGRDSVSNDVILKQGYATQLEDIRDAMERDSSKSHKLEKKLGIQLGGYQGRWKALSKRITDAFEEMSKVAIDLESFKQLKIGEDTTGPVRVEALKAEVDVLEGRERRAQERYKELMEAKREKEEKVAELEMIMMEEAERLNEERMAADA